MNTRDIYRDFRNFQRFNAISLVNSIFIREKNRLIEDGHKYHISVYGALGDLDGKMYPMRFEIFSRKIYRKKDFAKIRQFVNTMKPIGYNIGVYQHGTIYPVISEYDMRRQR